MLHRACCLFLQGLLHEEQANGHAEENGHAGGSKLVSSIPGFRALDTHTVKDYLAEKPHLAQRLGPAGSKAQWEASWQCYLCSALLN